MSNINRPQIPWDPSRRAAFQPGVGAPPGGGASPLAPSQPEALAPGGGVPVSLPGVSFPPAGAVPVDQSGDGNIAPGGTATLLSITVPDTWRFRVLGIGFGADDESSLRFLTWALRGNNTPYPTYSNQPAAIGSIVQLADIFLLVDSSTTFIVVASSAAAALITYRFISRVRGYFYQETVR